MFKSLSFVYFPTPLLKCRPFCIFVLFLLCVYLYSDVIFYFSYMSHILKNWGSEKKVIIEL